MTVTVSLNCSSRSATMVQLPFSSVTAFADKETQLVSTLLLRK